MKILFVGYGRMGSSIGRSWLNSGLVSSISAVDPGAENKGSVPVYRTLSEVPLTHYDYVVVGVKPGLVKGVLEDLLRSSLSFSVIISVAAGVTTDTMSAALEHKYTIVRAMPNTPALVGAGCTGLYARGAINLVVRNEIDKLFSAIGIARWFDIEDALNAVTAISGSGPAYYYLFSEALRDAAVGLGLDPETARIFAAQTAYGAAKLQVEEGADFEDLRLTVTSPNGTTAAAISVFEEMEALRKLVTDAAHAAARRSVELSA